MKEGNVLLRTVQKALLGQVYNGDIWKSRIIYSLCGQMALASLWDVEEENEVGSGIVSLHHFKTRVRQVCNAYGSIWEISMNAKIMEDLVYDIYRRAGFLYHRANYVAAAVQWRAVCGNVCLYSGIMPSDHFFMSGLGFYRLRPEPAETDRLPEELFDLPQKSLQEVLDILLRNTKWQAEEPGTVPAEYLRLQPPFQKGYWQPQPDKTGAVSILRFGEGAKIYQLYRWDQSAKRWLTGAIPVWMLQDFRAENRQQCEAGRGGYRRIAAALLQQAGTLPKICVTRQGNMAEIFVGYRLPPEEELFFRLYSWPAEWPGGRTVSADKKGKVEHFHRLMASAVYHQAFRPVMERIGYTFEER